MLRVLAIVYGMFFLSFGVLGFVPCLTPNSILFGLFFVNFVVNSFHALTGILAIWTGAKSTFAAKTFFQLAGFVYALISILGFTESNSTMLGIFANNKADTWVNLLIAILSLYFGFCIKSSSSRK